MNPKIGQIEVICGCMFCGKTEELIRRLRRATIARQKVLVLKHSLDTRYTDCALASHSGERLAAIPVASSGEIRNYLEEGTRVVAIDEAQFFGDELVAACEDLANCGFRVIIAGLDLDFRGEPFGPMAKLLARAEQVDKLQASCQVCGEPATRTQRLINGQPASRNGPQILVGASEAYEARCRRCHNVPD